jgi:hypothetical protein
MDINGLACSIELYLGCEVLKFEDGSYRPIEWRGLDAKLRQYQGEILEKAGLHKAFRSKLEACERDPSEIERYDWSGLKLVFGVLREAFQRSDSKQYLEAESWQGEQE